MKYQMMPYRYRRALGINACIEAWHGLLFAACLGILMLHGAGPRRRGFIWRCSPSPPRRPIVDRNHPAAGLLKSGLLARAYDGISGGDGMPADTPRRASFLTIKAWRHQLPV